MFHVFRHTRTIMPVIVIVVEDIVFIKYDLLGKVTQKLAYYCLFNSFFIVMRPFRYDII